MTATQRVDIEPGVVRKYLALGLELDAPDQVPDGSPWIPQADPRTRARPLTRMRLAVPAGDDHAPVYVDAVAWSRLAETYSEYLAQDRQVAVSGRLECSENRPEATAPGRPRPMSVSQFHASPKAPATPVTKWWQPKRLPGPVGESDSRLASKDSDGLG